MDESKETFWSDAPDLFKQVWRMEIVRMWMGIGSDIDKLISFEKMIEQWSARHLLEEKEATENTLIISLKDDQDGEVEQLKHLAFLFIMRDELRSRKDE
jgi:hypothetical protein